jgi:hypothetical protein
MQIGAIGLKVGVTGVVTTFIVTCKLLDDAQVPTFGVNVYTPVDKLLITAGDQVPVIPFKDVVGKTGGVAPKQIVVGIENAGFAPPTTSIVPEVVATVPVQVPIVVITKLNTAASVIAIPEIVKVVPDTEPNTPLGKLVIEALVAEPPISKVIVSID